MTIVGRRAFVWIPAAYDADPTARFPVAYLLHGVPGSYADWAHAAWVDVQMDALIAAGDIPPALVVEPDLYGVHDRSSEGVACERPSEDYVVNAVLPAVDAAFRTDATRIIGGLSDGGGCAVAFATHHPLLFDTAFSVAGYFPVPPDGPKRLPVLIETGRSDAGSLSESRDAAASVGTKVEISAGEDHSWPAFSQDLGITLPWAFSYVDWGTGTAPSDHVTLGAPAALPDGMGRRGAPPTSIRLVASVAVPSGEKPTLRRAPSTGRTSGHGPATTRPTATTRH